MCLATQVSSSGETWSSCIGSSESLAAGDCAAFESFKAAFSTWPSSLGNCSAADPCACVGAEGNPCDSTPGSYNMGVCCDSSDQELRLTSMVFHGASLLGSIPSVLGDLDALRVLDLDHNS